MEVAFSPALARRDSRPELELEQLRPVGEAFLLRRYASSLSPADAEDVVAEVVIRLLRRVEREGRFENLRAAFFISLRNAAIDRHRLAERRPSAPLEDADSRVAEEPGPEERAERREDALRLREVMGRMRPNYREVLVLRFGAGLSVPEIAERLSVSLPAAKKLVLRATEQARRRLTAIEGNQFCPETQRLARRSLQAKHLAGLASDPERALLQAHLDHCGSCRAYLAALHRELHELGTAALLAGYGAEHAGIADQATRLLAEIPSALGSATEKARIAAYKAAGALQPGDASGAGILAGSAQKVIAVCGAATATTATCLATGIVGPGVGAIESQGQPLDHRERPAQVRQLSAPEPEPEYSPPPESPPEVPSGEPASAADPSQPPPAEPAQPAPEQAAEEFGLESSPEPEGEPAPAQEAPPPSPSPSPSSPAGSGGGESFGFGG